MLTGAQLDEADPDVNRAVRLRLHAAASLAQATTCPQPFSIYWSIDRIRQVDWPGEWLLRCIFGDPFPPVVTFDPRWLNPDVVKLAEGIYEERAFDQMPILGDALEEAGCHDPEILEHCRSADEHLRGCWALDLVLGKS